MISVIVTTYNRADFLEDALKSLLEQRCNFPQQVIVCDDGSTDNTKEVINRFSDAFSSLIVLHEYPAMEQRKKEVRYVKMINKALPFCTGKYITYLSDDDLYLPNRNQIMVEFLETHPDIYLAYHFMKIYRVTRQKEKVEEIFDLNHVWDEKLEYWIRNIWNYIDHCSFVHRNLAFRSHAEHGNEGNKNILWEDDIKYMRCGDWGFLKRALAEGKRFAHVPECLAIGRKIEGQSLNLDGVEEVLRNVQCEK